MHHQAAGAAPLVQGALQGISGVFTVTGELRLCFAGRVSVRNLAVSAAQICTKGFV